MSERCLLSVKGSASWRAVLSCLYLPASVSGAPPDAQRGPLRCPTPVLHYKLRRSRQVAPDTDQGILAILTQQCVRVRVLACPFGLTAGYTSSAGIAANKLLAKIGSALNKPNLQTVIPPRSALAVLQVCGRV